MSQVNRFDFFMNDDDDKSKFGENSNRCKNEI